MSAPTEADWDFAVDEIARLQEILVIFSPVAQQFLDSFVRDAQTSEQEMKFVALVRNAMTASETGEKMEQLPE